VIFSRRRIFVVVLSSIAALMPGVAQQAPRSTRPAVPLPTTKMLTVPVPGRIGDTNSFPATLVMSPDGRYAALLNGGYGTQETLAHQSIAILDLKTNRVSDFPEARLGDEAHQSYFLGLAFSSDGKHLYASIGSLTDPTGEKAGDTGNGIAVYTFASGKVGPERFIAIAPQPLAAGKRVLEGLLKTPPHTAIPYPAGLALISAAGAPDKLLVANNLSDNVVLLAPASGKVSTSALAIWSRLRFPTRSSLPTTVDEPGAACGTLRRWRSSTLSAERL
jgi:hypothetical protein